nr:tyrosine-type recombinase/integrase [Cellvibrionaceae bacterium]
MAIKKVKGGWQADIQPGGRGRSRVRKTFPTKREAERFIGYVETQTVKAEPWNPKPKDNRLLSDLVDLWYKQHGQYLKDGARRLRKLERLVNSLGDPRACDLTPEKYLEFRSKQKVTAKTKNNELGYLNAVYNELKRTKQISYNNPLSDVRPIKIPERELSYLTLDQVKELLEAIQQFSENPHVFLITKICLATGCRWSEAESLHARQVFDRKINFTLTKSGKNRTVPIDAELEKEIKAHGKGKLFTSSLGAFRRALAQTSIELPKGQAAHALRHTFASHFVMNGGDIRTLQKILGHASITMTMR